MHGICAWWNSQNSCGHNMFTHYTMCLLECIFNWFHGQYADEAIIEMPLPFAQHVSRWWNVRALVEFSHDVTKWLIWLNIAFCSRLRQVSTWVLYHQGLVWVCLFCLRWQQQQQQQHMHEQTALDNPTTTDATMTWKTNDETVIVVLPSSVSRRNSILSFWRMPNFFLANIGFDALNE